MLKLGKAVAAVLVLPLAATGIATFSTTAQAAAVPTEFGFSGGGWGHGIGMSQIGALGMASEGASATKILTHFYSGTTVGSYTDSQQIRVNIKHRVAGVKLRTEALATGGGALTVDLGATEVDGKAGDTFTLKVSGTKLVVAKNGTNVGTAQSATVRWSGTRTPSTTTADDTKASVLNLVGSTSSFGGTGHRYRYGTVKVVARAVSGVTKLEAVNSLALHDEYLRGIGEVPSSWPKAALQAQVIAARSYAMFKLGLKGGCQCDVDSGQGPYYDQNFVGYSKESSSYGSAWRAAVAATNTSATQSKVVLYQGKPAQAFYSASTGGRTQNVKDVWGSTVPYLKSVDDHWSTQKKYNPNHASWGPYKRTQKTVAAAFGLPNVVSINLSSRYVSGALKSATATSSSGKKSTLSVGSVVARLSLTSNWIRSVKVVGGSSTSGQATASTAYKKFPLAKTKAGKVRYFGYQIKHPKLAKARVVNGGVGTKKYSADVKRLQTWLKSLGYLKATPNGYFGPATHAAVKKFQKAKKMKSTGLVGGGAKGTTGTWKSIQKAYRAR